MSASDPDPKLPTGPSRQRRSSSKNPWLAADKAERRKPLIGLAILIGVLLVGVLLILRGLHS